MRKGMSYYFAAKYHFLFKWPTITHVMQNQEYIHTCKKYSIYLEPCGPESNDISLSVINPHLCFC